MKTRRAFVLRFIEAESRFAAINASKAGSDERCNFDVVSAYAGAGINGELSVRGTDITNLTIDLRNSHAGTILL
jgi:hypothetical protein